MHPITWLEQRREYAPVFIRVILGVILIEGTADNVFHWSRMIEFQKFLEASGFPWPLLGAMVSAYSQFFCGILILVGAATRIAAAVMVINFIFALGIAHLHDGFSPARLALLMLFCSLSLLFSGAGKLSVDRRLQSIS